MVVLVHELFEWLCLSARDQLRQLLGHVQAVAVHIRLQVRRAHDINDFDELVFVV